MLDLCLLLVIVGNTTVRDIGEAGIEITFTADKVARDDYSFTDAAWLNKAGQPNLPSLLCRIGIPQDGSAEVTVVSHDETVFQDVVVEPVYYAGIQEPGSDSVIRYGETYTQNRLYPESLIVVSDPGYFRDLYTIDLRVNTVRYNPITKELRVTRSMKINVAFRGRPQMRRVLDNSYEEIYKQTVINYEQCRDWRRIQKPARQDPFAGSVWYKIEVGEEGIYKIGHDELTQAGLDPDQFDPRTMKVYTAPFDLLPRSVPLPDSLDSLIEIPVYVSGEADGVFDGGDYLVFYGYPASHYVPDTAIVWFENGYAINNVYWFTFGGADGRRMEQVSAPYNGTVADTFVNTLSHDEIDLGNPSRSGTNWYWADISPLTGDLGTAQVTVHHMGAAGSAQVRIAIFTQDNSEFWHRFSLNGVTFFSDTIFLPTQNKMPPLYLTGNGVLSGDSSALVIEVIRVAGATNSHESYLNAVDIKYERPTVLDNPFNAFFDAPRQYSIKCTGIEEQTFVLDITDLNAPRMLSDFSVAGASLQLSSATDSFQMLHFSKLSLAKPALLAPANPGTLRTQGDGCEYIVITHKDFYSAIMPLVEYRSSEYQTRVVLVDDIYNDFAFGKFDPLAIKHFLYYTTENWSPYPKYVLLVGDATYDYKNNLGKENPPDYVPMYEYGTYLTGNPVFSDNELYEGEYVNFGQGEAMCLGRITVRTRQEVRDFVDKLITYESGDIVGLWTKRIILTADDEYAYSWEHPSLHTGACERNANVIPDSLYDFVKVYMISYPPFGAGTEEKGNAREAYIREFNKGGLIGLFYGHGNTHQLAHEVLFLSPYMGRINNSRRNSFWYFGSCNVGRFDDSDYECLGEEFVRIPDGAIGTIAATAGTNPSTNEVIGERLCLNITRPDTTLTMGECSVIARSDYWYTQYLLIGDPATRFRKMYHGLSISATPDSVRPLEKLTVTVDDNRYHLKAFVRDTTHIEGFDASTADRISGYVYRMVQIGSASWVPYGYYIDGKEVYVGYWDSDTAMMLAPRVGTTNLPVVKLSGINGDRSGRLDSIRLYGTALPVTDYTGPEVTLYDGGRLLKDEDWVNKEFTLTGRVLDSSGINLLYSIESTNGFYLYINSEFDNKIDLRDYFYYTKNSYMSGEFNVAINLSEAVDTLTINVVDNNFNQTVKRIVLNTELYGQIAIENFLMYPNPLRTEDGLWFTFNLTRSGLVRLKIFTIAGRLIKTIDDFVGHSGYNQIYWDGLDTYQDKISNGVYIVKAYVEADNSRAEVVEKFIIAR